MAGMFLDIESIDWPPIVHLIYNVAALDQSEHGCNGRHGGSFIRLCVSLQCVSCSPCHRWWQSSVCDWFWRERRADILSSRCKPGTHSAQCPKAWPGAAWHQSVRRCCSVSVYLCCCSSSIYFNFSLRLSLNWLFNTPSTPLTPHLSPKPTPSSPTPIFK